MNTYHEHQFSIFNQEVKEIDYQWGLKESRSEIHIKYCPDKYCPDTGDLMRQTARVEQFYKTLPKVIFFGLFSNTCISEQSDKSKHTYLSSSLQSSQCTL